MSIFAHMYFFPYPIIFLRQIPRTDITGLKVINVKTFEAICRILFIRLARHDIHFPFDFLCEKLNLFKRKKS